MTPFLLMLALAATPPVQRDLAGNRLEAFAPAPADAARSCSLDRRWCARIDPETAELLVFAGAGTQAVARRALDQGEEGGELVLWSRIVRLAGPGVFIGVEHRTHASYSGGGGGASTLELIRVAPGEADPKTVLTLPIEGSLMIRACFDEKDQARRRGACHDEYDFAATLTLDPQTSAGPPRFRLATVATAFPAGVSRNADSTQRGRLSKRDLVKTRDPACSYRRVLTLDAKTGAYAPDRPLPNCEDYTVP